MSVIVIATTTAVTTAMNTCTSVSNVAKQLRVTKENEKLKEEKVEDWEGEEPAYILVRGKRKEWGGVRVGEGEGRGEEGVSRYTPAQVEGKLVGDHHLVSLFFCFLRCFSFLLFLFLFASVTFSSHIFRYFLLFLLFSPSSSLSSIFSAVVVVVFAIGVPLPPPPLTTAFLFLADDNKVGVKVLSTVDYESIQRDLERAVHWSACRTLIWRNKPDDCEKRIALGTQAKQNIFFRPVDLKS